MATLNKKVDRKIHTHGGALASNINPEQQLRRSVMACMLWEDSFYEDGESIANRICELVRIVEPEIVHGIAVEAREKFKLRHVPLLLARLLAKRGYPVADLLNQIIRRPDELSEFLAIYWKDKKEPLSAQVKKGLAKAFTKFDEYQLAKYNRDTAIKLRDVLFLCHAKPKDKEQEKLWKKLIDNELAVPDTWEVNLSSGKDKKEVWTEMLKGNRLGALALLRNLRNMLEVNVEIGSIRNALTGIKTQNVLPFRFITAAKHVPKLEPEIETAMFKCLEGKEKLKGKTVLIVDTSGSMYGGRTVSARSELTRIDAAAALAILIREVSENPVIYATAGNDHTRIHATAELPARRGFSLSDKICNRSLMKNIGGGGIFLKQVMDWVYAREKEADRIIVITDEQDCDNSSERSPSKASVFGKNNYLINVSVEKNGIGYDKWTHINGWSEAVVDYIYESEKTQ